MPAAAEKPNLVVAWQPFSVLLETGEVTVAAGQIMSSDHPVVKQVPHFFNPVSAA